jgi:diguanylate cyclase (GGDEF)-like protein
MLIYSTEQQQSGNKEKIADIALNNFNQLTGLKISKDGLNMKIIAEESASTNPDKPLNSFISSEVYSQNSIMGILLIGSYQENAYSDIDMNLFKNFAAQASIVIDNSRLYQKLESLSITDELTKIYNMRYLYEILPLELGRAERYNRNFSIIMFDIDFFKKINDTYGHIQGDNILREVAGIARATLRKADIPVRYGGDEFVIFLPEADLETAKDIAERIKKSIKDFSFPGQKEQIHITVSLGVAGCTKELMDKDGKKLFAALDKALYEAKNSGRDRVCIAGE